MFIILKFLTLSGAKVVLKFLTSKQTCRQLGNTWLKSVMKLSSLSFFSRKITAVTQL